MSAIPEKFHITKHMQSARATEYFSRNVPINLTKATMSSAIHFKISALPNTFLLPQSSYLKFRVTNMTKSEDNNQSTCQLSSGGAMALFDRISLTNAGASISNLQNYGLWRVIQNSQHATKEYLQSAGDIMNGTKPSTAANIGKEGASIQSGESRVFVDCLANHASLFGCNKAVALDLIEPLDLQYVLGSFSQNCAWTGDSAILNNLSDNSLQIDSVELVLNLCQLDQNVARDLLRSHGEKGLCYECTAVNHVASSIQDGVTASSTTLGLGYSSLLGLDYVMLPLTKGPANGQVSVDPRKEHTNSTFVRNFVDKHVLILDGTPISSLRNISASAAENMAYSLIKKNKLDAYTGLPLVDENAIAAFENDAEEDATINLSGRSGAIFTQDLSIYKGSTLSHEGRGTISSSSSLEMTYSQAARAAALKIFLTFRQLVVLDPVTRTYRVAQ